MMRALLIAVFLPLAIVLFPSSARADSNKMQVLTIVSPDAFENAKALTIALKRAVTRADGWSLAPGDYSMEVLMAGFGCDEPPNDHCLSKVADSVQSDRFIWGTLSRSGDEVVVHLRLWEDGRNVSEAKLDYAANLSDPSDDALLALAEDAFHELLGVTEGTLVVLAGSADGDVLIDGEPQGELMDGRTELLVPAGDREVSVSVAGFREARGTVTVRPGTNAELVLELVPLENAAPEAGESTGGASTQRALGYGAIGVGSLTAVVGGAYWVASFRQTTDGDYEAYQSRVPQGTDPCEVARGDVAVAGVEPDGDIADHCDNNQRTRGVARVLTPAGVVIAVAGVVLVATSKSRRENPARREVRPSLTVGPRGGRLDLRVRF